MSFWSWLTAPPEPVLSEHSTLAELIASSELQALSQQQSASLGVAAVLRARQMNADTLSALPVITDSGLAPAPNARQDSQEFVNEIVLAMQDYGEAYVRLAANGDMDVLQNVDMQVRWNSGRTRRQYIYRRNQQMRVNGVTKNLIVLAVNRGAQDLRGFGWCQSTRVAGIIAELEYSQQYFESHGKPSGILKVPGEMSEDEAKMLKAQWDSALQVRSTAVISTAMEYNATSFSPSDSQWVETHNAGVGDVSTLSGVPSSLLNFQRAGSNLTYENISDLMAAYWRQTLSPTYASRIERMWSETLQTRVVFDPEQLFLSSLSDRAQAASVLATAGYPLAAVADVVGFPPFPVERSIPDATDS